MLHEAVLLKYATLYFQSFALFSAFFWFISATLRSNDKIYFLHSASSSANFAGASKCYLICLLETGRRIVCSAVHVTHFDANANLDFSIWPSKFKLARWQGGKLIFFQSIKCNAISLPVKAKKWLCNRRESHPNSSLQCDTKKIKQKSTEISLELLGWKWNQSELMSITRDSYFRSVFLNIPAGGRRLRVRVRVRLRLRSH